MLPEAPVARERLPLSVLAALGLASCGPCLTPVQPQPCLSVLPPEEPEAPEEPPPQPCLSVVRPEEPEPVVQPCLEAPPEPPPQPCLSFAPPEIQEVIPEAVPQPCLSEVPVEPEPPPRPCLSVRLPVPPPEPEPADDDGASAVDLPVVDERVALLEQLGAVIPEDVLRRL
jgi:hypothetical protein